MEFGLLIKHINSFCSCRVRLKFRLDLAVGTSLSPLVAQSRAVSSANGWKSLWRLQSKISFDTTKKLVKSIGVLKKLPKISERKHEVILWDFGGPFGPKFCKVRTSKKCTKFTASFTWQTIDYLMTNEPWRTSRKLIFHFYFPSKFSSLFHLAQFWVFLALNFMQDIFFSFFSILSLFIRKWLCTYLCG